MIRRWSAELSVHHPGMDEQHRRLFALAETLWRAGDDLSVDVDAAVQELVNYTYSHFAFEEALLQEVNYPNFRAHKKQHEAIFLAVDNIVNRLGRGERRVFVNELAAFVSEWLVQHILTEDQAYGRYLMARAAAQPKPPEPMQPPPRDPLERLRVLKTAFDEGLISEAEYGRRKDEILAEI